MTAPGSNPMARWLEDVWLSRYLDRELSDEEQSWFEAYMLDKPHLLESVDADTRLRDAVRNSRQAKSSSNNTISDLEHTPPSIRPRTPRVAVAASLLIGLGLGAVLMQFKQGDEAVVDSPPRMVFDTMRGEGTTTFSEAGNAESNLLIVDIATPLESKILSASVWHGNKQTALPTPVVSSEGFVTFVVPSSWKGQARIELEISSATGSRKQTFQL